MLDEMARQQGFAPFDLNLYFRLEQRLPPGSPVPVQWAPSLVMLLAEALWQAWRGRVRRAGRATAFGHRAARR